MTNHTLEKSPLVETVLCFDFAGIPSFTQPGLLKLVTALNYGYERESEIQSRSFTFNTKDPAKSLVPVNDWRGTRFKKQPNHVLMLSNVDGQIVRCAYSLLAPYKDWASFTSEAITVLRGVLSSCGFDPVVKRMGIRSINKLNLGNESYPVSSFFVSFPKDPCGMRHITIGDFFHRETACYRDYGLYATTVKCGERNKAGAGSIIFDTDVFCNPNVEFSKLDLTDVLDRGRRLKDDLFFGTVTDAWEHCNHA